MGLSLRQWRPRHLLFAWVAYRSIAVRSAVASIWRVTFDPDAHGSIIDPPQRSKR